MPKCFIPYLIYKRSPPVQANAGPAEAVRAGDLCSAGEAVPHQCSQTRAGALNEWNKLMFS